MCTNLSSQRCYVKAFLSLLCLSALAWNLSLLLYGIHDSTAFTAEVYAIVHSSNWVRVPLSCLVQIPVITAKAYKTIFFKKILWLVVRKISQFLVCRTLKRLLTSRRTQYGRVWCSQEPTRRDVSTFLSGPELRPATFKILSALS